MDWYPNQTKFIKYLESGGFGKIYAVENKKGEIAAIKKCNKLKHIRLDYRNEADILQRLNHPNIIKCLGQFENVCYIYQVLEYIEGEDLFDLLGKKRFTNELALEYVKEIKRGLDYIHSKNIIHRDIKLENIMNRTNNRNNVDVVIIDFGFAEEIKDIMEYRICGTVHYLPPEIIMEKPYNHTVDLWSLGVLGYELVNLKPPFQSRTESKIKKRIVNRDMSFNENFNYKYGAIINKLLSMDPRDREFEIL